jgi:hypothetical protein
MKLDLKLEIAPYQGISDIHFGMTSDRIRSLLNETPTPFRRTPQDEPSDHYTKLGIQIYYSNTDICEAIELATPAAPTFNGKTLIGQPFDITRDWLQTLDPDLETDETGLTSHKLGIGIYAPFAQSHPQEPIESIISFAQTYYS